MFQLRSSFVCWLLVMVTTINVATAQMGDIPAQVRWGTLEKAPNGSRIQKVVSAGAWGAFFLRYKAANLVKPSSYWLERYSGTLNLVGRHEITLPEAAVLEDVISLNGQLHTLYSIDDVPRAKRQLWARPLGSRGNLIQAPVLLTEIAQQHYFRQRQFALNYSRDSSTLLLYHQYPPKVNGDEIFSLYVFDDEFVPLWSQDVSLPYRDDDFYIQSYQVDPDGNVYILGRLSALDATGKRLRPVYVLLSFTRDGQLKTTFKIDLDAAWINTLSFEIMGNGDLVCGGLYQEKQNRLSFGICYIRINPITQEATTVHQVRLPSTMVTSNRPQEVRSSGAPIIDVNYRLRDLTLRSDGGMVLVAEQFRRQSTNTMTYRGLEPSNLFHYEDILVANMAPDGTFSWLERIPKLQSTVNDQGAFSSFAQLTVRDRFYFLYNEQEEQFTTSGVGNPQLLEYRQSVVALSELNRSGELTTVPLYLNRDMDVITQPRLCKQVGSRRMLLYAQEGRRFQLGWLIVE